MPDDLILRPARGLPDGLVVPGVELTERFSRSAGPGGQGVNTTDSRVELRWDVASSTALTDGQRDRVLAGLRHRIVDGTVLVTASEHRSQRQNRDAARARLAGWIRDALLPAPPARRATRPSRSAQARRVEAKRQAGRRKALRRRPGDE